jgi:ATP phosphoribosyltransferase regulatory subunit HisZ
VTKEANLWDDWEKRLLHELERECIEEAKAEEESANQPKQVEHAHDLMTAQEVCEELEWYMSTLRRNTRARKLAYIKRDGRV